MVGARAFGADSVAFAFLVVWVPMAALGAVSHFVTVRLPQRVHRLRPWEADGRAYEILGVRLAKRLLRRGPLAVFNPHLHLPHTRDAAGIAALDRKMREAEASHLILFVLTLAVVADDVARRWWEAAGFTLLFDIVLNGYPVMLQRYNRAMLARRFGGEVAAPTAS